MIVSDYYQRWRVEQEEVENRKNFRELDIAFQTHIEVRRNFNDSGCSDSGSRVGVWEARQPQEEIQGAQAPQHVDVMP